MGKKLTYNEVKSRIEFVEGYKLLSTMYESIHNKLIVQCPKDHVYKVTLADFGQGKRCPYCAGTIKHSIKYLKNKTAIIAPGYKLLSNVYVNSHTNLEFRCNKDHIFKMSWSNFNAGKRCGDCSGNKKLTYEFIKEQVPVLAKGYKLLSIKYINARSKLKFRCDKGHEYKSAWYVFNKGHRCPECQKCGITYVRKKVSILEPNYKLLSTRYINNNLKLKFKCDKGHIFYKTWASFDSGSRCPECVYESLRKNYTLEELKDIKNYKQHIKLLSEQSYTKCFYQINPKRKSRSQYKHHLDHIYSVMEGFRNFIPPEVISNPNNLQMLWWKDNIRKKDNSNQTKKDLYLGYYKSILA